MNCTQITFSPTGGTKRIADILIEQLGECPATIDLANSNTDFSGCSVPSDNIAVIAVPSYGGRVPQTAAARLSAIKGNHAKAVIVCVYGNRAYEDTLAELQDIAEGCGFQTIAAVAAIAEHSIMHQYAAGRPDGEDTSALNNFAKKIQEKLTLNDFPPLHLPGNRPYKKQGSAKLVSKANSACIRCGKCAIECPVSAIDKNDPRLTDSGKCISCMRCVAICPNKARHTNKALVSAVSMAIKKACSERKECELYI